MIQPSALPLAHCTTYLYTEKPHAQLPVRSAVSSVRAAAECTRRGHRLVLCNPRGGHLRRAVVRRPYLRALRDSLGRPNCLVVASLALVVLTVP